MNRPRNNGGFTLVEVALAIGVLIVGLAAVTSIYLTGLRWIGETRTQYTSLHAARCALESPELLLDARHGKPLAVARSDGAIAGWHNGYYCVRSVDQRRTILSDNNAVQEVTVEVYSGGTDEDGELVQTVEHELLLLGRH